jgi:hypothetical protein
MVSFEAAPFELRSLLLHPVADQGNGQGNYQGCHRRDAPAGCAIVRQYQQSDGPMIRAQRVPSDRRS